MKTADHPPNIAFFDSSQGGLTVWESVVKKFPLLNTQYLGDNARCPYGNKSEESITRYATEAALFLEKQGALLLVVACGTASSVAIEHLRQKLPFPVIGIVEGFCRTVAKLLTNEKNTVAVLGTRFTIASQRFARELLSLRIEHIWQRACPLFVPLVEEGIIQGPIAEATSDMYLWDIPETTEVVMLACTHYPRLALTLAESLEKRLGKRVVYKTVNGEWVLKSGRSRQHETIFLVDSSLSIVQFLSGFIKENENIKELFLGKKHVFCTDSATQFEEIARFFTSVPLPQVSKVNINLA